MTTARAGGGGRGVVEFFVHFHVGTSTLGLPLRKDALISERNVAVGMG